VTTGRRDTSQPSSVVKRKNRLLILAESDWSGTAIGDDASEDF
jgi:hypothetical protein